MTSPGDRRWFLSTRGIARAARELEVSLDRAAGELERVLAEPVATLRREAMACLFEVQFGALETDRATPMRLFDLLDALEAQLTVYSDDSEISRLNRDAREQPVEVEPELFGLLARCRLLWEETGGAFDVTAGPLIEAWGFLRRQGRTPSEEDLAAARAAVGMDKLALDPRRRTVRFLADAMKINLGAIGKGYALDRMGRALEEKRFGPALLSAGHSSILARGRPGWDDGWRVDLLAPTAIERPMATVRLVDRALSTSGVSQQYFVEGGRRYGHLLDPRTGRPAGGMLQATLVAPDAALAEALSTAAFILGVDAARELLARRPDCGAILVPEGPAGSALAPIVLGAIEVQ